MEELLKKYIRYVALCEGTDFLENGMVRPYHEAEEAGITKEDEKILMRLSKEVNHD